jgi:tRNA pseudouridine13 synthase
VPRFTDFLVFEVDLDGKSIHLKSIGKPASLGNDDGTVPVGLEQEGAMDILPDSTPGKDASAPPNDDHSSQKPNVLVWQDYFAADLAPFLNPECIQQLKDLYLQGRNPPRVSDSGWAGCKARSSDDQKGVAQSAEQTTTLEVEQSHKQWGGSNKTAERADDRKVVSEVLVFESLILRTLTLTMLSFSP